MSFESVLLLYLSFPGTIPRHNEEPKSSYRGEYVIVTVATVVIVIALGIAGSVACRKNPPKCKPNCSFQFGRTCSCCVRRNQDEEPEQIPEPPVIPLLSLTPAPPPTMTALLPWTPPIVVLPPPTYEDAMNYPEHQTAPPSYDSV